MGYKSIKVIFPLNHILFFLQRDALSHEILHLIHFPYQSLASLVIFYQNSLSEDSFEANYRARYADTISLGVLQSLFHSTEAQSTTTTTILSGGEVRATSPRCSLTVITFMEPTRLVLNYRLVLDYFVLSSYFQTRKFYLACINFVVLCCNRDTGTRKKYLER